MSLVKKQITQFMTRSGLYGARRKAALKFSRQSFAQEGEDLVLMRLFEPAIPKSGYFIDVGAHHPSRFSTTKLFYDRGWRGLNIDPRPGFAKEFLRERPEDIAIEAGVGEQDALLTYFMFNEPALNSFDADLSAKRDDCGTYRIVEQHSVPVYTLASLLDRHVPLGQAIDFMTVDVECLNTAVIRSNDWEKYRPKFLLVKIEGQWLSEISRSETAEFLSMHGYYLCSRTRLTAFFQDSRTALQSGAA